MQAEHGFKTLELSQYKIQCIKHAPPFLHAFFHDVYLYEHVALKLQRDFENSDYRLPYLLTHRRLLFLPLLGIYLIMCTHI